ncbi:MAG: dTDP-4-dehydrorhamnose reductase [Saprospiraceae bacterium]
MSKTILVTGAGGQLGQCLKQCAPDWPQFNFIFTDRGQLDIADKAMTEAFFNKIATVDYCLNCAAYTAVDKAESEPKRAFAINRDGVAYLAEACRKRGVALIHFSTDYVYGGHSNRPLTEDDPVQPAGVYAQSKLEGERRALQINPLTTVIRTSWVYSEFGHNFLKTMLRLGRERSELNVVFDQVGTPTYAGDLALAVLTMIEAVESGKTSRDLLSGIYHYSNEGVASWYDFAEAIFELAGLVVKVHPIETKDFPTPAARPAFSVLNKAKIKAAFGLEIAHWRVALVQANMRPPKF